MPKCGDSIVDPVPKVTPGEGGEPTPTEGGEPTPKGGKAQITPEIQAVIDKAVTDRLAREKKAHEKEKAELLGKLQEFENKDLDDSEKLRKEIDGHKSTLQAKDTELSGLRLENTKIRALLKAGVKPEQVDEILGRVQGTTPEEIEADVTKLKTLGWIGQTETPTAAQGAGNPGVPGTPGKKTWTKSEIQKVAKTADAKTLEEINLAQREGRVDYDK